MLSNVSCIYELEFTWLKFVQHILNECGMPYIWNTHTFIQSNWIVNALKLSLKDQFQQSWHTSIQNSPTTLIYRCFKKTFEFEKYLEIPDNKYVFEFFQFWTTNHKLPIEAESESVDRRKSDNTMAKAKRTKGQTTIYKA